MHRQYITAKKAHNLYWLGRHIKRLEIEMVAIDESFDKVIDKDKEYGRELFKKLDIELTYQNTSEYLEECIYGDHECNLYCVVQNARENCIIARNYLPQDAFTAIIELSQLFKENEKRLNQIDYNFINAVLNIILRIWGAMHQFLEYKNSYDFIRLGRLVEKVDLGLRLDEQTEFTLLLIDDIDEIALRLNSSYQKEKLSGLRCSKILDKVNNKINRVVTDKI
jgi:uncharacterized alpha-E superfamily protein